MGNNWSGPDSEWTSTNNNPEPPNPKCQPCGVELDCQESGESPDLELNSILEYIKRLDQEIRTSEDPALQGLNNEDRQLIMSLADSGKSQPFSSQSSMHVSLPEAIDIWRQFRTSQSVITEPGSQRRKINPPKGNIQIRPPLRALPAERVTPGDSIWYNSPDKQYYRLKSCPCGFIMKTQNIQCIRIHLAKSPCAISEQIGHKPSDERIREFCREVITGATSNWFDAQHEWNRKSWTPQHKFELSSNWKASWNTLDQFWGVEFFSQWWIEKKLTDTRSTLEQRTKEMPHLHPQANLEQDIHIVRMKEEIYGLERDLQRAIDRSTKAKALAEFFASDQNCLLHPNQLFPTKPLPESGLINLDLLPQIRLALEIFAAAMPLDDPSEQLQSHLKVLMGKETDVTAAIMNLPEDRHLLAMKESLLMPTSGVQVEPKVEVKQDPGNILVKEEPANSPDRELPNQMPEPGKDSLAQNDEPKFDMTELENLQQEDPETPKTDIRRDPADRLPMIPTRPHKRYGSGHPAVRGNRTYDRIGEKYRRRSDFTRLREGRWDHWERGDRYGRSLQDMGSNIWDGHNMGPWRSSDRIVNGEEKYGRKKYICVRCGRYGHKSPACTSKTTLDWEEQQHIRNLLRREFARR